MEFVKGQAEFTDILAKILDAIPAGFVFDDTYIVDRLAEDHPDEHLKFLARYADRNDQIGMAADEIGYRLHTFEGVLVEELQIKVHFPTLHNSLTAHKLWKKI